ncbi:MAG: isoprenylcysteine carboxylmethyltransferase family protein [Candidatus Eisenbacteria bacterium]|uniref:Isoprenylcysteine carboxylmethyltransferase family protein n=1 Tax=Eiseniibacteriota bacterium TaxID=2212470 RepID=A0A849SS08_UNCEI|nr:isoprenylcysteine carboxylmethyltransferase family protein [Candidatus Eisenbacteria bacterium]
MPRPPLAARLAIAVAVSSLDAGLLALALGGIRQFIAHPQAVALAVVWALLGLLLAALQPVRSSDAVAADRDAPWRFALLGLLPFLIPPLSALADARGWMPLPFGAGLRWAGVSLAALGFTLRVSAIARLGSRFAPEAVVQRDHQIETHGPYRVIRHPGYLGAWLTALGGLMAFASSLAMPLLVLFAWLLATRARTEDALLERHFGETFRAYRDRTGAFLPRLGR